MNPSIAQPAPPKMMPNKAVPRPQAPAKTELMQSIPVKAPANHSSQTGHNPIAAPIAKAQHDKALDVVLKDVTHAVKNPQKAAVQFAPPAKVKKVRTTAVVPITMAVIVACALSAAAYYSFGGSRLNLPSLSIFGG